jgi:hypothetical protein
MSRIMTEQKLAKAIFEGYGTGPGETYRSWIRVRRRHSSPVSNLRSLHVPACARALQLLFGLEFAAANVAIWPRASEVREQHPLWPNPHPHPASGMHQDYDYYLLGQVPGLLEVAKDVGIDHGVYPGTKRTPLICRTLGMTGPSAPLWRSPDYRALATLGATQ